MNPTRVVALCGGIGGAKLALGLYRTLPRGTLAIIANTGDDFDHLGLRICPDVDTVLYTLAGLANRELGWGRQDETWTFMQVLGQLGGEDWFRLGDGDLALHLRRTQALAAGKTLSDIIADVASRFGVSARILPMSEDNVRTQVGTPDGELAFQDYFVRQRCGPRVCFLRFAGAESARPSPGVSDVLESETLEAILICPSNPYLSIDPILAVPGMRALLRARGIPVIAVTPLIAGQAVKGPTAKIMQELGLPTTAAAIAKHYAGLIDGFVLDGRDRAGAQDCQVPVHLTNTLMVTLEDRERLAREVLAFAARLRARA